jgi:MFS family permease
VPGGKGVIIVEKLFSEDVESRIWHEVLSERAGVPEDERLVTPAVFVGSDARVGKKITDSALCGLLAEHRAGSPAPQPAGPAELAAARARLNARFQAIGLAAVLAGGLVDGINPCAFVTLIFLVGYLTASGRRGREILLVGAAFTAAVFCTYFLTGIGLAGILHKLDSLPRISEVFTWGLALLTFCLAGLSAWDALLAWRGRGGEAKLALPGFLRRRVSLTVAREFRTRTVVTAALVTGFLVSIFEFVCTGQIYLPLIRLMISFSASRGRALSFLAAYNAAFVVPLVITFVAVYAGSTSQQLTGFFQRHLALSKLLACLLFIAMGVLLLALR